ncbi:tetracycline resistance MFS efflux pump [soil metagenome]
MTPIQKRTSPLVFLFVTVFVDMVGYGIVIPLLPFYAREYSSTAVLVGILGSLYAAMQFFGGPVLGGLSDRVGRRPVLLFCLFGASGAYLLLGLAGTLWVLILAVLLAGGAGATLATAQAYIADSTNPEDRAKGLGLIGAAFGLGLITGPAAGGLLSLHTLSTPAFAASAIAFSNVLFGFFVLPESLPPDRKSRTPLTQLNPVSQLKEILRMDTIRPLLLVVFLLNLSFAGLLTNFPLFSNARFGWDATSNAFFFAFVGVCAMLTQGLLIGYLQPRLKEWRLVLGGLSLVAVNLGLMAIVPYGFLLYPVVGILAVGAALTIPSVTAIISRLVPRDSQGKLMGGIQAILSLTLILGPLIAGMSFDYIGVPAPYWIGGLLAALALLVAARTLLPSRTISEYSTASNEEKGA